MRFGLLVYNAKSNQLVLLKRKYAYGTDEDRKMVHTQLNAENDEILMRYRRSAGNRNGGGGGGGNHDDDLNSSFLEQLQMPRGKRNKGESEFMCSIREFIEETKLVPTQWFYVDDVGFDLSWVDGECCWTYRIFFIACLYLYQVRGPHFDVRLKLNGHVETSKSYSDHDCESLAITDGSVAPKTGVYTKIKFPKSPNYLHVVECNKMYQKSNVLIRIEDAHDIYLITPRDYITHLREKQLRHYQFSNYESFIQHISLHLAKALERINGPYHLVWVQREPFYRRSGAFDSPRQRIVGARKCYH